MLQAEEDMRLDRPKATLDMNHLDGSDEDDEGNVGKISVPIPVARVARLVQVAEVAQIALVAACAEMIGGVIDQLLQVSASVAPVEASQASV